MCVYTYVHIHYVHKHIRSYTYVDVLYVFTYLSSLPQWFCHVDDDVYVNLQQLRTLLSQHNSSEPYYIGRFIWGWKGCLVSCSAYILAYVCT